MTSRSSRGQKIADVDHRPVHDDHSRVRDGVRRRNWRSHADARYGSLHADVLDLCSSRRAYDRFCNTLHVDFASLPPAYLDISNLYLNDAFSKGKSDCFYNLLIYKVLF